MPNYGSSTENYLGLSCFGTEICHNVKQFKFMGKNFRGFFFKTKDMFVDTCTRGFLILKRKNLPFKYFAGI